MAIIPPAVFVLEVETNKLLISCHIFINNRLMFNSKQKKTSLSLSYQEFCRRFRLEAPHLHPVADDRVGGEEGGECRGPDVVAVDLVVALVVVASVKVIGSN